MVQPPLSQCIRISGISESDEVHGGGVKRKRAERVERPGWWDWLPIRNARRHRPSHAGAEFYSSTAGNGILIYFSGEFDNSSELHWLARDGALEPIGTIGIYPQLDSTGRHALINRDEDATDVWLA